MKRFLSSVLPVVALLAFAAPASAQIAGHNVVVNANVTAACTLVSAGGDITLFANLADLNAMGPSTSGALSVRCTRGVLVEVVGSADTGLQRLATCNAASCGADTIGFSLFVTSAGTDAPLASTRLSNTLQLGRSVNRGTPIVVTYQAQFDPAADPRAGTYSATVPVTYVVTP